MKNPCASNPCKNGALCDSSFVNGKPFVQCKCRNDFYGPFCDKGNLPNTHFILFNFIMFLLFKLSKPVTQQIVLMMENVFNFQTTKLNASAKQVFTDCSAKKVFPSLLIIQYILSYLKKYIDINECELQNSCLNGAECHNFAGSYECTFFKFFKINIVNTIIIFMFFKGFCKEGYFGQRCENGKF